MSLRSSCRLVVRLATALALIWARISYGQNSNCNEYNLENGIFTVCLSSNQNLAYGARPTLRCDLTPENTDACHFDHWELNGTELNIVKPNYMPLTSTTMHGASFRIEMPSPAVAGTYRCQYSCNGDTNHIATDLSVPFIPSVEFVTPDNLMYWAELGTSITLNCSINFYTTFFWKYENETILPVHSDASARQELMGTSLTISDLAPSDNNTYRCSAKNSVTSDKFIRAYLFVYLRPKILNISNTIKTAEGNKTMMTCTAYAIPKPFIVWSKETDLTFGGRFQEETVDIDSYTLRSTLVITHTSSSDEGAYHCTAFNKNGTSSTFGTVKETIQLNVIVPVGPFLEAFNTSTNATSITVGWIVSGVLESNPITVEWRFLNGTPIDTSPNLPQEPAEFQITSLSPETSYVVTVRANGLEYNITITTPQIPEPDVVSSTSPTSTPQAQLATSMLASTFIAPSPSFSTAATTPTPVQIASSNDYIIFSAVVGVTVLLALLIVAVMIVIMIAVLRKKSDSRKSLEHNGSLSKPPYSNDSPPSYRQQLSGSSMTSLPTLATMVSQDSSMLQYPSQHSFSAMDFAAVQGLTGRAQLTALNTNGMIENVGFISTTPPAHNPPVLWTIGQPQHVRISTGAHETFEMTENPANQRFEMEKSRAHLHPGNPTPEPGFHFDSRPGSIPPYLGSESASQVHLHSSHSMPRGVPSPYNHTYPEQEEEFEYTENAMYERHVPPIFHGRRPSQEPSQPQRPPLSSCSSLDGDSPRFKIVSRERGAVFEEVKIKPQP